MSDVGALIVHARRADRGVGGVDGENVLDRGSLDIGSEVHLQDVFPFLVFLFRFVSFIL